MEEGHSGQIRKAAKLLLASERPVIYAGGGVVQNDASEELIELVSLLNLPVTNTLMGLGAYLVMLFVKNLIHSLTRAINIVTLN